VISIAERIYFKKKVDRSQDAEDGNERLAEAVLL